MRAKDWSPRIQTGAAFAADRFTIALGEVEYDDPFSFILSYDGAHPQPWTRVDIEREIVALTYTDKADPVPLALSNEGDVYALHQGGVEWTKIPGAGLLSEDAAGFGATYTLLVHGQDEFVLGHGRQLYRRRDGAAWEVLSADHAREPGYEPEAFTHAVACRDGSLIIAAFLRPGGATGRLVNDPRYREDMTSLELVALMNLRNAEAAGGPPVTRLYRYRDGSFTREDVPEDINIRDIHEDANGHVWIVGVGGLILRDRPGGGFERLDFRGDTETLISAAWFRDALIVASDYGLHRFDGHALSRLKPVLNDPFINRNTPTPVKLQVVDDVLFYFDYKHGVCRWDGKTWDWIDIPDGLLEREFKGLR